MDKYEYKVRADEIKDLIARGEYASAVEIADTIDWRRVKSVMMLCTISDLYKINRRYEDARNMLFLAYERRPGGRTICYSLCELSIKMEDFVAAIKYYKEFVQVAPKDPGRYILQYKLYEAQDVSLEERIGVLEELKKRDYREKWAYELAYLYHRVGLATRCVEECDELILWFGEGKYVIKAMELKMLHQPLTDSQQEKYDHRFEEHRQPAYEAQRTISPQEPSVYEAVGSEAANYEVGGKTKIYEPVFQMEREGQSAEQDMSTMQNEFVSQEEFAVQETYTDQVPYAEQEGFPEQERFAEQETFFEQEPESGNPYAEQGIEVEQEVSAASLQEETRPPDDLDIQVKTMDMGQYNTINLQAEIAAGLKEVLEEDGKTAREDAITRAIMAPMLESETESLDLPEIDEVDENDLEPESEVMEESEVFFGETGEIGILQRSQQESEDDDAKELVPEINTVKETLSETISIEPVLIEEAMEEQVKTDVTAELVMEQLKRESRGEEQVMTAQPPKELAEVLSQESDGQISLVIPESEQIEKQITGQMNLEDVLVEWERMKQENAEKRKEEVRQHVLRHTGEMFTAFEASVRDGLLEQLENSDEEISEELEENMTEGFVEEEEPAEEPAEGFVEEEKPAEEPAEEFVEEEEPAEEPTEEFVEEEEPAEEPVEASVEEEEPAEEPTEASVEEGEPAEEPVEESSAEDFGESEDWDSQPYEEPSEEEKALAGPSEPIDSVGTEEPKVSFGESDGVEEIEEIEEPVEEENYEEDVPEDAQKVQTPEEPKESEDSEGRQQKVRSLTKEEKELYGPYIQSRASREQLVKAIDAISMAAYTGNVIITGEEGMDTVSLAKNMIREMQMTDSNFAGKVAKISGQALNKKDVDATLNPLASGALIIQKASALNEETVKALHKALQKESFGIIIVLEDTKKAMNKFLEAHDQLAACFTARMDVEALSNDTLVAFGKQYAKEKEYSIDELGILALHTRIDEMQTIDHVVTVLEVKELVDDAIHHANRKNVKHFLDILFARRYDEEDMIILSEKDFVQ